MKNFTCKLIAILYLAILSSIYAQQDTVAAVDFPTIIVVGSTERMPKIAGSALILNDKELLLSRVFNINEALKKAPGVNIREEDAFALRPNIGIRGLNPTRSTKILLLEDGIPLAYALYGDNASYYHPPVERFEGIEILKGSEQVIFGPQTIGGVINYLTPKVSKNFKGNLSAIGGTNNNFNSSLKLNYMNMLFNITHKRGDGTRQNEEFVLNDMNYKGIFSINSHNTITLRSNFYYERSTTTYSGMTQAEFDKFGYNYNPFKNDKLEFKRIGLSATHLFSISNNVVLTTSLYGSNFKRDWWRQSSTTTDAQGGAAIRNARLAGNQINVDSIKSNQGRLREYFNYGVEPRLDIKHKLFDINSELKIGLRIHIENQYREQTNGTSPLARSGTTVENNERYTTAFSSFIQNRFVVDQFTFTPVLRIENIKNKRVNNLTNSTGNISFTDFIPGFGLTFNASENLTLFAGIHKGFAPPRTEDLIVTAGKPGDPLSITAATYTDVNPERSTVIEIGTRTRPVKGSQLEVTLFRNKFQNQIAVGSIAGGSTPLAQGQTLYQGIELFGKMDLDYLFGMTTNTLFQINYTFLPEAKQIGNFVQVADKKTVEGSKNGNRLPYASKHLLTTNITSNFMNDWSFIFETSYVSDYFSDFAETIKPTADGQKGLIKNQVLFNATVNYSINRLNMTLFLTAKNLANKIYISDRTRGIRAGSPRLIQFGLDWSF